MPARSRASTAYRWALVALVGATLFYIERREIVSLHLEYRETRQTEEGMQERLAVLEAEAVELERTVENLKSDPVELEAAIRAEKKLLREGETIYRIELPDESGRE